MEVVYVFVMMDSVSDNIGDMTIAKPGSSGDSSDSDSGGSSGDSSDGSSGGSSNRSSGRTSGGSGSGERGDREIVVMTEW